MLPKQLAVRGERHEKSRAVLDVNVARLGIDRRAGIRVAQINDVAQEVVEELLPEHLARLRIEAGHAFLQLRAFAEIAHDVELAVGDHGRRLAGKIRRPQRLLCVDFFGQSFLERNAGLKRTAPIQPAGHTLAGSRLCGCGRLFGFRCRRARQDENDESTSKGRKMSFHGEVAG